MHFLRSNQRRTSQRDPTFYYTSQNSNQSWTKNGTRSKCSPLSRSNYLSHLFYFRQQSRGHSKRSDSHRGFSTTARFPGCFRQVLQIQRISHNSRMLWICHVVCHEQPPANNWERSKQLFDCTTAINVWCCLLSITLALFSSLYRDKEYFNCHQDKMRGHRERLPVQPLGYVVSTKVIFRRAEVSVLAEVCLPRRPHAGQPRSDAIFFFLFYLRSRQDCMWTSLMTDFRKNKDFRSSKNYSRGHDISRLTPWASLSVPSFSLAVTYVKLVQSNLYLMTMY